MGLFSNVKMDWTHFEKVILGFLLIATTGAVIYNYLKVGNVGPEMPNIIGLFLAAFVVRKGLSYFKPNQYYENKSNTDLQFWSSNGAEERMPIMKTPVMATNKSEEVRNSATI
jgi:L-lactate permease